MNILNSNGGFYINRRNIKIGTIGGNSVIRYYVKKPTTNFEKMKKYFFLILLILFFSCKNDEPNILNRINSFKWNEYTINWILDHNKEKKSDMNLKTYLLDSVFKRRKTFLYTLINSNLFIKFKLGNEIVIAEEYINYGVTNLKIKSTYNIYNINKNYMYTFSFNESNNKWIFNKKERDYDYNLINNSNYIDESLNGLINIVNIKNKIFIDKNNNINYTIENVYLGHDLFH